MINALCVETDGVYFGMDGVKPWDINADAFNCDNGFPAIAHPPCKRWGRYAYGGPSVKKPLNLGDDKGCFAFSLWYVRTFGGVIEHPEASHAWRWFGLERPPKSGGWIIADDYGGLTCCVEQGHYGHRARKATWLYLNGFNPVDLIWGKSEGRERMDDGFHSSDERRLAKESGLYKPRNKLGKKERLATPEPFRDLLINLITPDNDDYVG